MTFSDDLTAGVKWLCLAGGQPAVSFKIPTQGRDLS
jgi:hypothetical protein